MKKAMENVEKHYAVVGILSELNKTLTVLEHYVPRFFKGALETYWSKSETCIYLPKYLRKMDLDFDICLYFWPKLG